MRNFKKIVILMFLIFNTQFLYANTQRWGISTAWLIQNSPFREFSTFQLDRVWYAQGIDTWDIGDATYGMQGVFTKTFDDPNWQRKYKKELQTYQFYQKKFANLLQKDDYAVSTENSRLADNNKETSDSFIKGISRSVGREEICIMHKDGSYELVTLQDGKVISREKQNRAI